MDKRISIVIPVYNDYERLISCLEVIKKYENSPLEVIVVNNNPYDRITLPEYIQKNFDVKVIIEKHPGSYAARNKGIKLASGDIIGFTDSDMLPDPKWIEVALNKFKEDIKSEIGILTGPVPLFYKNPDKLSWAEIYEKYTGFDFESYANEGACGAGNWFSYKTVLEEFGGFREDLKSNGDTELSLRISSKYKVMYVPELINRHPARYFTADLVFRYRRIIGGAYTRRFENNKLGLLKYIINFVFRRYRFSLKKFFTVPFRESFTIFMVCNALNFGVLKEFFSLISGGETKR